MVKKQGPQPSSMMTAAIYARYSSAAQNDASIEQQVAECKAYAEQNNLAVVAVYDDRAMTGRNDKRPGFQRMIRAAERHEFQVLLTYKSNRLARNMLNALAYEDKLDKAGIKVVYCKEDFGNNAAGRLALRMMMSINEFYSDNLSEDVKRGMRDSAKQCKVVGAVPYGYKKGEGGKMVVDEDAAPIVLEIFKRVLNGESYMDIARDLNARGIRTAQGKEWAKHSFHVLLTNERYTGVYIYGDMRIENGIPAIIDKDMFQAVQNAMEYRSSLRARHSENGDYILTGKLFCGHCLSPMVGISGKGRRGGTFFYYACQTKRLQKTCKKKNVRKSWIEEEVTRAVVTTILDDNMIEWIADAIMDMAKRQREESQLTFYENRLAETKKQIANIVRAVEFGIISDEFKERMAQLEEDKKELERLIAVEKLGILTVDREHVVHFLYETRKGNPSDKKFQKRIVRDFIRAVYLYDDHFKLVVDFTGKSASYEFSFHNTEAAVEDAVVTDSARVGIKSIMPRHNSLIQTLVGADRQGFVIIWYFEAE